MSNTNTTTTDAADLPGFIKDVPEKRTRRFFARCRAEGEPIVRDLDVGTVAVSLFGARGAGREMLLDRDVWETIRATIGPCWVVNGVKQGTYEYVRSGKRAAASVAMQRGPIPSAYLSRIIMGATRKEVVLIRSGDALDLRRENLELQNRKGRIVAGRKPHSPTAS